jgi:CRISPR-associated protein Csx17
VARGVSAFERYGYLTRNGKSNYAIPLGRWEVRLEPRGLLLDDLDGGDWLSRVRRAARDDRAPASFVRAERVLADAMLAALAHGAQPRRWSFVLVALAELEHQLVLSGTFTVKARLSPIPPLSPAWLGACDEGRPELRLALALAGAGRFEAGQRVDHVRCHWLPLDPRQPRRFHARERRLADDPRVVCGGRDAEATSSRSCSAASSRAPGPSRSRPGLAPPRRRRTSGSSSPAMARSTSPSPSGSPAPWRPWTSPA